MTGMLTSHTMCELAALFGGAFTGIGMALVLKAGATTGGTDMVAAIIQSHMRHYTVVQVMQVLDAAIVILGLYVFGLRPTLYAVVSIFVSTKISDAFLEGFKTSKAAFIITNRYEEVAERLMDELDRGDYDITRIGDVHRGEKVRSVCLKPFLKPVLG